MQKEQQKDVSSNEVQIKSNHDNSSNRQEGIALKKQLHEKAKSMGISISQLKKQIRKEKWQKDKIIKRKEKRQEQKQRKKQKKKKQAILKQQGQGQRQGQGQYNNININYNENIQNNPNPNQIKNMKKRKQDYQQKMKDGLKVVLDLQFYDLMTQKQLNSLVKQLSYCHSSNRKVEKPFNYILTSTTCNI